MSADVSPVIAEMLSILRLGGRNIEYCFSEDAEEKRAAMLLLPSGERLALATLPADGEYKTGGRVWHSAPVLCRWMCDAAVRRKIVGSAVLELGSGTGACGLFAAALGACSVLLTDGDERLLDLMAHNLHLNTQFQHVGSGCKVTIERLMWARAVALPTGPFDWCFGSDVIYDCATHDALCATLAALLRRDAHRPARAVLATMPRQRVPLPIAGDNDDSQGGSPASSRAYFSDAALVKFVASAATHGLRVTPLEVSSSGDGDGGILPRERDERESPFDPWPLGFAWSAEAFRELPPFLMAVECGVWT